MRSKLRLPIRIAAMLAVAGALLSGCGSSGGTANVRMLNMSTGYSSLDLYASNNNNSNPSYVAQVSAVTYPNASNYTSIGSGTYSLEFRLTGVTSALATDSSESLTDGSHTAYVGYGSVNNFATLKITEDQSSANTGYAKVTVYNVSEAGGVDIYLTAPGVPLQDASPTASNVAEGGNATVTETSGTYELRVVGTGNTSDLRADVPDLTFNSTGVYSVLLSSTPGGVLVNVGVLPQQGALSVYNTSQARIRGAVGIPNSVNATVDGTSILTNATLGVIGGTYTLVNAGAVPVTLNVDGTAVAVPNQTLAAGGDYTLLVWSNASGTQTTLISDSNTQPANLLKYARVRVLNGMSGLGDPLTLLVNFQTDATGVAVGTASSTDIAAAEFTGALTTNEVDVLDTNTTATLYTKQNITLADGAVYTMFMAGTASSPVGTLRQDR
jgi:Domain of unknown function (DUF4397)